MKLTAYVAFSGEFGDPEWRAAFNSTEIKLDVDAAADALKEAGYEVHRLPEKLRKRLDHPLDDFLEAWIEDDDDDYGMEAVMDEVESIVAPYGGACHECGPVAPGQAPFTHWPY
jgi:hypothetical protein